MNLRKTFEKYIISDVLIIGDCRVDVDFFLDLFAEAQTYEDLINIDGGFRGYKDFFEKCHEEGILN